MCLLLTPTRVCVCTSTSCQDQPPAELQDLTHCVYAVPVNVTYSTVYTYILCYWCTITYTWFKCVSDVSTCVSSGIIIFIVCYHLAYGVCTVPHYNSVFTMNVIWCYFLYIICAHNYCVVLLDFVSVCMCTVRQCVVFP